MSRAIVAGAAASVVPLPHTLVAPRRVRREVTSVEPAALGGRKTVPIVEDTRALIRQAAQDNAYWIVRQRGSLGGKHRRAPSEPLRSAPLVVHPLRRTRGRAAPIVPLRL